MKRPNCLAMAVAFLGSMVLPVAAMNTTAVNEVLKLTKAGLGDEGIVAFINSKHQNYELSADDIVLLKNQGVSAAVLTAMVASGGEQPVSANPPQLVTVSPTSASSTAPVSAPWVSPSPVISSPVVTTAPAPALSADAAYFHQQLSPYGQWLLTEDNQWSWQPTIARGTSDWRPYWDQGHWVYTDTGWYWASDYPWGWAAFHYGRWRLHPLHGWLWYPGRTWSPAWVMWRSGGDYCGWAPLPPGAIVDSTGVLVYRGRHVPVDFDFGLDWHAFNFCLIRELGQPHWAGVRRAAERREIFGRTAVLNHVALEHGPGPGRSEVRVINRGIEPDRVAAVRGRKVETMHVQELHAPAPNRAHERFDRDHKTVEIYRPHWGEH